jgi:hypothetical protein
LAAAGFGLLARRFDSFAQAAAAVEVCFRFLRVPSQASVQHAARLLLAEDNEIYRLVALEIL